MKTEAGDETSHEYVKQFTPAPPQSPTAPLKYFSNNNIYKISRRALHSQMKSVNRISYEILSHNDEDRLHRENNIIILILFDL